MNAIATDVLAEIKRCLADIQQQHHVRILYACESGSRAWGFESKDSDYDVRFIYARPRDWYLSIDVEQKRDVIEVPISDDLDICGWDMRKTLQLFHKSNPPLNEWLDSPIVYQETGEFTQRLRELAPEAYNPIAAHYHYLSMASRTYRAYLKEEVVRRKKYFYALRPLLAVNWIEKGLGVVPTRFDRLVAGTVTDATLLHEIEDLLAVKRAGKEADEGPRLRHIHAFVEAEMLRHEKDPTKNPGARVDLNVLNDLFRSTVQNDAAFLDDS